MITKKLYCYVDESGQDTLGKFFAVAVVVLEKDKEELTKVCEQYEIESGKGKLKWRQITKAQGEDYVNKILSDERFQKQIVFSSYKNQYKYLKDYHLLIILSLETNLLLFPQESSPTHSKVAKWNQWRVW